MRASDVPNAPAPPVAGFVAHYVEPWNVLLKRVKSLNDDPYSAVRWVWAAVYYYVVSIWYKYSKKQYDMVDEYQFNGVVQGRTYLLRNFAWHFIGLKYREVIKLRIIATVVAMIADGVEYIGLGALVKDHSLTEGGIWILRTLQKLGLLPRGVWLIHGDTMTSAVVEKQVLALRQRFGMEAGKPVFVIGASSKIGRAVCLSLAARGVLVRMFCDAKRFALIRDELHVDYQLNLEHASSLEDGRDCQLWLTGKAIKGREIVKHLPRNAVVLNFSVPDPLSPKLLRNRPDVCHLDGGMLGYDPKTTSLSFRMRLVPGLTYACHAGTITHARMRWQHHEVDQVDVKEMERVLRAGYQTGFFLPPWTSFLRPAKDLPELITQLPASNIDAQPAKSAVGI